MDNRNQMIKDFGMVQKNIEKVIKACNESMQAKKRIIVLIIFTIIVLIALFLGFNGIINPAIAANILSLNLLAGIWLIRGIDHPEKLIAKAFMSEVCFWEKYKTNLKSDMKEAGVMLAGDNIVIPKTLDNYDLLKSGLMFLIAKDLCAVKSTDGSQTIFQLASQFPQEISELRTFTVDQLIDWSNAIALLFVILYSDTIGLLNAK